MWDDINSFCHYPIPPSFLDCSSLGYSQLKPPKAPIKQSATSPSLQTTTSINENLSKAGRILRCLSKPSIVSIPRSKSHCSKRPKRNEEVEREWLLLGEPISPRNTIVLDDEQDTSSLTIPNPKTKSASVNVLDQDVEGQSKACANASDSDSDSSTDIDAVFDEYRQKIEVTASGPSEKVLQIPSIESWRLAIIVMIMFFVAICFCVIGFLSESWFIFVTGFVGTCGKCLEFLEKHRRFCWSKNHNFSIFFANLKLGVLIIGVIMAFLPRYAHSDTSPNILFCCSTIFIESILIASTFSVSLPAILAWVIGGKDRTKI